MNFQSFSKEQILKQLELRDPVRAPVDEATGMEVEGKEDKGKGSWWQGAWTFGRGRGYGKGRGKKQRPQ